MDNWNRFKKSRTAGKGEDQLICHSCPHAEQVKVKVVNPTNPNCYYLKGQKGIIDGRTYTGFVIVKFPNGERVGFLADLRELEVTKEVA